MDYYDRLSSKISEEKLGKLFIQGKISDKEFERKVREIGSSIKKNKRK